MTLQNTTHGFHVDLYRYDFNTGSPQSWMMELLRLYVVGSAAEDRPEQSAEYYG